MSVFRRAAGVVNYIHSEAGMAKERADRLVRIAVAHDEVEVGIWRDALETEGVPVFTRRSDPLASLGGPPPPGSLELYVSARDEKRARWVLGEIGRAARGA